jgi:hypothetical protein
MSEQSSLEPSSDMSLSSKGANISFEQEARMHDMSSLLVLLLAGLIPHIACKLLQICSPYKLFEVVLQSLFIVPFCTHSIWTPVDLMVLNARNRETKEIN